ncbi:MAG: immunoglobulin domain-containing protein [Opitutales bacterium]|nr:immunoglobulin domain-containing protein [Opitutales bacterium]
MANHTLRFPGWGLIVSMALLFPLLPPLAAQGWQVVDTFADGQPQAFWMTSPSANVTYSSEGLHLRTDSGWPENAATRLPITVTSGKATIAFEMYLPEGAAPNETGFGAGSMAMLSRPVGWQRTGGNNRFQTANAAPQNLVKATEWGTDLLDPTLGGTWYAIWMVYDLDAFTVSLHADPVSDDPPAQPTHRGTWALTGANAAQDYSEITHLAFATGGWPEPPDGYVAQDSLGGIYRNIYASEGENLTQPIASEPVAPDPVDGEWTAVETVRWGMPEAEWGGDVDRLHVDFSDGYLHLRPTENTHHSAAWVELPEDLSSGQFTVTFDFYLNGPEGVRTDMRFDVVGDASMPYFSRIVPGTNSIGATGPPHAQALRHSSSTTAAIPVTQVQENWYHFWVHYDIDEERIDFYYAPLGSQPTNAVPAATWSFATRDPELVGTNFRYFTVSLSSPGNPGVRIGNLHFSEGERLTLSPTAGTFEAFVDAFAAQPVDTAAIIGSSAQLNAELTEPDRWSLRWQVSFDGGSGFTDLADNSGFTGTATPGLILHDVTTFLDDLVFRLRATAEDGEIQFSDSVVLTVVTAPPVITFSTADRTVPSGEALVLAATVEGGPAATMRWQRSADGGETFEDIPDEAPFSGVFGPALTINPAEMALDGHIFRIVATNEAGTTSSWGAHVTVLPPPAVPSILAQPEDQSVRYSHAAAFEIAVEAHPPEAIRWQLSLDGGISFADLSENAFGIFTGTATPNLVMNAASAFFDGIHLRARVYNSVGQTFTEAAQLTLRENPTLAEWAGDIGLPPDQRGPRHRHGSLGLTTLEAFAFGLHPEEHVLPSHLPHLHRADGELRLRYRRNIAVHGLSFLVEVSPDLAAWTVVDVEDHLVGRDGESVEVREAAFEDGGEDLFLRLRLAIPEE